MATKTALATLLLLLTANAQEAVPRQVPLDQEFTIKFGERVSVEGTRIRISFANIVSDSRCPPLAVCFHAGNAEVNLELAKKKRNVLSVIVNTTDEPKTAEFKGLIVKLVSLSPRAPIPADYEATLIVSSARE